MIEYVCEQFRYSRNVNLLFKSTTHSFLSKPADSCVTETCRSRRKSTEVLKSKSNPIQSNLIKNSSFFFIGCYIYSLFQIKRFHRSFMFSIVNMLPTNFLAVIVVAIVISINLFWTHQFQ